MRDLAGPLQFLVVVNVDVDHIVAGRFQQVGVFHEEAVVPLILGERADASERTAREVVSQARCELIGDTPGILLPSRSKGVETPAICSV